MAKKKKLDHLSRDVLEAQRLGYGVRYGAFKADHPVTCYEAEDETEPETKRSEKMKTCAECGKKFAHSPYTTNKRYCCEECRIKHNNKKRVSNGRRKTPGAIVACPICGTNFQADHKNRVYCSRKCSCMGNRQKTREYMQRHKEKKEAIENGSTEQNNV